MVARPFRWGELSLPLEAWLEGCDASARCRALESQLAALDPVAQQARAQSEILHDLANLTSALTLNCQLMRAELNTESEAADTSVEIPSAAYLDRELGVLEHGLSLIRQLHERARELSRDPTRPPEAQGQLTTTHKTISFAGLVDGAASLLQRGGMYIDVEFGQEAQLAIEPLEGVRLLFNLLHNAQQATREIHDLRVVPTVKVRLVVSGGRALIRVEDNGPGIPPGLADRIFEPGVTTRGESGGTGMGLFFCRQVAEAWGGSLTLCASGPGARFTLELPLA